MLIEQMKYGVVDGMRIAGTLEEPSRRAQFLDYESVAGSQKGEISRRKRLVDVVATYGDRKKDKPA